MVTLRNLLPLRPGSVWRQGHLLKLGFTNPLPDNLLKQFAQKVDIIYVLEENDPYLEHWVKSMGIACKGKEIFPAFGELTRCPAPCTGPGELPVMEYSRDKMWPALPPCAPAAPTGDSSMSWAKKNVVVSGDVDATLWALPRPTTPWTPLSAWGAPLV